MLYSVQLKNMHSYLNSSLKLSDIVCGLSCQQSYCNLLSLYKLIIIIPFILSYNFFTLSFHIMFSLIPSDANSGGPTFSKVMGPNCFFFSIEFVVFQEVPDSLPPPTPLDPCIAYVHVSMFVAF